MPRYKSIKDPLEFEAAGPRVHGIPQSSTEPLGRGIRRRCVSSQSPRAAISATSTDSLGSALAEPIASQLTGWKPAEGEIQPLPLRSSWFWAGRRTTPKTHGWFREMRTNCCSSRLLAPIVLLVAVALLGGAAATTTSCPANHYYDGSACEPCIAGTTAAAHPADNTHPGCKCDGIPRVLTPTELNDGLDCPTACMDGICYRISIF